MVLRIGRGELPAAGVAAIAFAVLFYVLDLNLWFAMGLAVAVFVGVVLIWPPVTDRRSLPTGEAAAPEQAAYEEALSQVAALRVRAARIAKPDVQDRVVQMLDHAERILDAMNEDGNLAAAPVFTDGWVQPFQATVTEYDRLSRRDVKSARVRANTIEACALPRFEAAIEAFDEELNRAPEIDLAALRDVLESYVQGLDTLPPAEEAPELPAEATPELTDSSAATESFAPGADAARNAARFGLTTREHEILILLVQSHPMKTDQELATDLCIAIKTVNAHVGHILGKLGLKSRRELPAFAAKHGLLPPSTPDLLPE